MKSLSLTSLVVGQMAANCHIVFDENTHEGIIIDPGDDAEYISDTLLKLHVSPTMIVATHGHFDHIMAAYALKLAFDIPFCIHASDAFLVSRMEDSAKHFLETKHVDPAPPITSTLTEGQEIAVGSHKLLVMHTPGHTPGGISLYETSLGVMFTGDTMFADGGVGRTDHSYSSREALVSSIKRILSYPKETRLLSGHGRETTVGAEADYHVQ